MRRVTAVVLAGGASQRFAPDKLAEQVQGQPLLDRTLASLPAQVATVIIVGAARKVARPVIFTSEDPPGGGPAAGLVAGVRRALAQPNDAIVTLPADAPLGGQAASTLLSRLESDPTAGAVVGVDANGLDQPLQLAMRPEAAAAFVAAAGPGGAAGVSARRLLDALRPGLVSQELAQAELWDIDTPDQLLAWRLRSATAVTAILDLIGRRKAASDRPLVLAIDGPSCAGKSILGTAVALRSGASVLEGDDFYRDTLPQLTVSQREAMSDVAVVNAVIDWERLRDQALLPLLAGTSATFQPYNWETDDGRLAPPKTIPAAEVIIVEGVYAGRPELADLVDLAVYLGVDPETRARRYADRENDPDWAHFWERGEAYYFSAVRPPASFDLQLDDSDLR
ncbi:MAG TPA: NTP transferase domain-containing protein [Propionibacteriaceae bacterium]|nr:NTP transferase domain-containing protein [Propionibacteriaceae bacterium]